VAAPPLQQVVLNPEQSAQELVSILIDELQKYEDRHQCIVNCTIHISVPFSSTSLCVGDICFQSHALQTHTHTCTPTQLHTHPTHIHTPHTYTHTYTHTHTHTLMCTHAQVRLPTLGLSLCWWPGAGAKLRWPWSTAGRKWALCGQTGGHLW